MILHCKYQVNDLSMNKFLLPLEKSGMSKHVNKWDKMY